MFEKIRLCKSEYIRLRADIEADRRAAEAIRGVEKYRLDQITATDAERNRLIMANTKLVEPLAAKFRGGDIPFEELVAEGMKLLVEAAHRWNRTGTFPAFAEKYIKFELLQFVEKWENLVPHHDDEPNEKAIYEWQNGFSALHEQWDDFDPHIPSNLLEMFEEISERDERLRAALIGLTPFERSVIEFYFLKKGPALKKSRPSLSDVAEEFGISYKKADNTVYRALRKMRKAASIHKPLPRGRLSSLEPMGISSYSEKKILRLNGIPEVVDRQKAASACRIIYKRENSNIVAFPTRAARRKRSAAAQTLSKGLKTERKAP